MPTPPYRRRVSRSAVATLGAAGLVALGAAAAPAAVGDEAPPSLALGDIKPITGVIPGSPVDLPVTVVNNGTTTVDKVWIKYTATRGLAFPEVPSNCQKQYVGSYDEMPERWIAICAFDEAVKPGVAYTPQKPFAVKAEKHAFDDEMWVTVTDYEPSPDENSTPIPGTAPEIELIESPTGGTGSTDRFRVPVRSVNTADYEVTGAALRGKPGDTVTMKVTFTNMRPWLGLVEAGDSVDFRPGHAPRRNVGRQARLLLQGQGQGVQLRPHDPPAGTPGDGDLHLQVEDRQEGGGRQGLGGVEQQEAAVRPRQGQRHGPHHAGGHGRGARRDERYERRLGRWLGRWLRLDGRVKRRSERRVHRLDGLDGRAVVVRRRRYGHDGRQPRGDRLLLPHTPDRERGRRSGSHGRVHHPRRTPPGAPRQLTD